MFESDRQAFLNAICDKPEDNAPRLIFADWLDEHGEEDRAEFIRVQIELARLRGREDSLGRSIVHTNAKKIGPLMDREQELLSANRYAWIDGLLGPVWKTCGLGHDTTSRTVVEFTHNAHRSKTFTAEFCRGMIGVVACTLADWLAHGQEIVKNQPVTKIEVKDRSPERGRFDFTADTVLPQLRGRQFWAWSLQSENTVGPMYLPYEIFMQLEHPLSHWHRQYLSEAEANDALSAACLRLARSQK